MVADRPGPRSGSRRSAGVADGSETSSDPDGRPSFEAELARLEREGATMLVVSTAPKDVTRRFCRTMLGGGGDRRRRVLGLVGSEVGTAEVRLPANAPRDPDHLQVVDFEMDTRSAVTDAAGERDPSAREGVGDSVGFRGGPSPGSLPRTRVAEPTISEFGAAIARAVDGLVDHPEQLDPQELRVCVDGLDSLLDAYGSETVQRFVHVLRGLVSDHEGLAHLHLPVSPDHPDVSMLAPLCDVLVEVRNGADAPQYRLSIADGPTSEWLPVPER